MGTPSPIGSSYKSFPKTPSSKTYFIAGISTTIYGLEELAPEMHNVACLWLLHPRLQTHHCMIPIAAVMINEWNGRKKEDQIGMAGEPLGLIAATFDQRNHGLRMVDELANRDWRSGNEKHAQDMFSIYHGTAIDTSQLITYLPSYLFPDSNRMITNNMVLGVSLGGHAAWHCLLQDTRITTVVVVIGCPDYLRLMYGRAQLSKLKSWMVSTPPGSRFFGSTDFPESLVEAVERHDPASLLFGKPFRESNDSCLPPPPVEERQDLISLMKGSLQGKRILNLAGGADKLVPYECSEPFLSWLKHAIAEDGWLKDNGVVLEDIIYDGIGHTMNSGMVAEAQRFIYESLSTAVTKPIVRASKV